MKLFFLLIYCVLINYHVVFVFQFISCCCFRCLLPIVKTPIVQIIDLLVPPRAAGVAGTLIFVHIANFATLQPWLHVGYFTCRILIHYIRTRDPYFYVPLRDTELCD